VEVEQSEEGGQQWRCRFNISVLAQEGKRWNEALPDDEAEVATSSWLYGKEA
jgi:hypothetical protein